MPSWFSDPQFRISIGGKHYYNSLANSIQIVRPENNISYAVLNVGDFQSKSYIDIFDAFTNLDIYLRAAAGDSLTHVFSGNISTVAPKLTAQGEVLEVGAWGEGQAAVVTHCDESYGAESIDNNAVVTPKGILDDLIAEHINKEFGGAASGWGLTSKVDNAHAGLSITFLDSRYDNNFVNINRVCDVTNAYAQGLGAPEVSVHWFVDPSANLYMKKIDADHTDGNWNRYWRGTQTLSTIRVKMDMIRYDFRKNVEEYANHIVMPSLWRMPSEDVWTEDHGGQALWGDDGNVTLTDSATSIVGSHSLLAEPNAGAACEYHYPAAQNAAWDLTAVGSRKTVPTLNFWCRVNDDKGAAGANLRLYTQAGSYYGMYAALDSAFISAVDEWTFVSVPVGPYFMVGQDPAAKGRWVSAGGGAESWANINWLQVNLPGDNNYDLYLDDLHFAGIVVREARDAAEIAAHGDYQRIIRNDTAANDSLVAATDSGTIARLCYAELLRRSQTPTVGMIEIPLAVDLLPGQTVHPHACQKDDNTYRIDKDVRVKELTHMITVNPPKTCTLLNLTDDVTNTHAFGVPDMYSLLKQYAGALWHGEARDLKGGGIDPLIPRLSKNY